MAYNDYEAANFERKVGAALQNVKAVLDNTRNPRLPKDVGHTYDNKFTLAESAVKSGAASLLNVLGLTAGVHEESVATMTEWAKTQTVTFSFAATETCTFVKTRERNEESATSYVTERTGFLAGTSTSKSVTKITEHFWKFGVEWTLSAFAGTGVDASITLASRKGSCELMTVGKEKRAPAPEKRIANTHKLDVSWLVNRVTAEGAVDFSIDRGGPECHTPRRNKDVEEAVEFLGRLVTWADGVAGYLDTHVGREKNVNPRPPTKRLEEFSPILGMFVFEAGREEPSLSGEDYGKILAEHMRRLQEYHAEIAKVMPAAESVDKLNTVAEMGLCFGLRHCRQLCMECTDAVMTVEAMLRRQVVAAIGKEVGPNDLTQYMEYHCRQLLRDEFQPKGFCYAVRRPDHYPEGTLSIEYDRGTAGEKDGQPLIRTVVHSSGETEPGLAVMGGNHPLPKPTVQPMKFALDAATTVSFTGERHLHACVLHRFTGRGGGATVPLRLLARARQFSSFVLMVGKIASAELFEPTAAMIVRDKDDLEIPLMLETMPTPKEFKDAIESLSPEQQRFCKAFRAMQLASTLFGVCVIQIKPQLERLLNLPADSLTKEIQLTNDLMELFTKYQIPSDLISYAGSPEESPQAKLLVVKEHVAALMATIAKAKEKEVADEKQEAEKANAYFLESKIIESNHAAQFFGGHPRGGKGRGAGMMNSKPLCRGSSMLPLPPPSAPPSMAPPSMSQQVLGAPRTMSMKKSMAPPSMSQQDPAPTPAPAAVPSSSSVVETPLPVAEAGAGGAVSSGMNSNAVDYTQIPSLLDRQCEALDRDNALRPTTIKTGDTWRLKYQKGLLSKPDERSLRTDEQGEEKAKAFDLLDALSRSGVLSIEAASLHVVLAATHCFDKTMMDTIVQENVNPIEPVERSMLIVAGVVHGKSTHELLQEDQVARVAQHAPLLLADQSGPNENMAAMESESAE